MTDSIITKPVFLDETALEMLDEFKRIRRAQETSVAIQVGQLSGSWGAFRQAVAGELAQRIFPVGSKITDEWTDVGASQTYAAYEWHVADYIQKDLRNGDSLPCAILQAHWAHPFGVQFSHQRAFLACPEGLPAGTYYFTIESSWGTHVTAGDVVCFTLAQAVPAGGKLSGCYGAPDQAKSTWRIYSHSADGMTILETVTPTFVASGTSLGTMHASSRNGNLNSVQEMAYGCNRWKTSAIRQYLNSAAAAGAWWTAQDAWDIAPNELATKAGYLSGFSDDFIASLREVKVVTYGNTVTEGGVEDITYDRIWLPSLEEMYINPQVAGEGDPLAYWREVNGTSTKWSQYGTYEILRHFALENHASAQDVRLRSAYRGYAANTWFVNSSGSVGTYYFASHSYRFSPLAAIG